MSEPEPYKVRTTDGVFVAKYRTEKDASASASERDARAEALGVAARYVVEYEAE